MNPLDLIDWSAVERGYKTLAWLAVILLACLCLAATDTAQTLPPGHGRPHVVVLSR